MDNGVHVVCCLPFCVFFCNSEDWSIVDTILDDVTIYIRRIFLVFEELSSLLRESSQHLFLGDFSNQVITKLNN